MDRLLKQEAFEKDSAHDMIKQFSLDNLSTGIYFLQAIHQEGATVAKRFMVQH